MLKKTLAFLLVILLLFTSLPAFAEVERSPYLDAAFSCLEKDNIFQRRYNEITGANVESVLELGIPYYFGGNDMERITSRAPEYSRYKCWETTKFYRKDKLYVDGFDCSGFTQWVYAQVGMPRHDSLSNMILKWEYERNGSHLYNHRPGHEMPPYDQLKDTLQVGDLLVGKQSARHIMMYIGTLADYNFTSEEVPELAEYLDYPLVIHCGTSPVYGARFQEYIDNGGEYFEKVNTTNGGVQVSIIGVPLDKAPVQEHVQITDYSYFLLDNGNCPLTIWDLPSCTSFCWFRFPEDQIK